MSTIPKKAAAPRASDVEAPTRPKPATKPAGGGAKPPRRPPAPPSSPARAKAPAKAKKKASPKPAAPEGKTKTDMLVEMMSKPGGATSKEMETAAGWLPHSVRGLIGTLKAKGVKIVSKKIKGEPTIYQIAKGTPGAAPVPPPASAAAPEVGDVV